MGSRRHNHIIKILNYTNPASFGTRLHAGYDALMKLEGKIYQEFRDIVGTKPKRPKKDSRAFSPADTIRHAINNGYVELVLDHLYSQQGDDKQKVKKLEIEAVLKSDPNRYFDQFCFIKYKSSIIGQVEPGSKREKRLMACEPLLKDGCLLKFSSIIDLANKVEVGAAGKRLLFVGVMKDCWEIVNIEGTVFDARFVDSNGKIEALTPRLS
jgi:hypothetical protein